MIKLRIKKTGLMLNGPAIFTQLTFLIAFCYLLFLESIQRHWNTVVILGSMFRYIQDFIDSLLVVLILCFA